MLNKNLQDEVLIQIVGRILRKQRVIVNLFDTRIQSEIIFMLQQKMFLMDDHVFEEGDLEDHFYDYNQEDVGKNKFKTSRNGQGIFVIIQGEIIIMHK
jgi:hypothetical protein